MLTTWLLSQPPVLGQARPDGRPAAAIGDIGVVLPGHPVRFDAAASYDPGKPGARLSYTWNFGDGQSASGRAVRHAYAAAGSYRLRLTVAAGAGRPRVIARRILVGPRANFATPYASLPHGPANSIGTLVAKGLPPANPAAVLPTPAPGRRDQVGTAARARRLTARARRTAVPAGHTSALPWAFAGAGVLVLLGILLAVALRARRGRRTGQKA
jgi:hypothetical protein